MVWYYHSNTSLISKFKDISWWY